MRGCTSDSETPLGAGLSDRADVDADVDRRRFEYRASSLDRSHGSNSVYVFATSS
jgi:hypothetical protein